MSEAMIQTIIQGVLLGGLYAALGLGLSMIFGIVKITNLAHGDFLILPCYLSLVFMGMFKTSPFVTLIIVIPIMFFVGFGLQRSMVNRVIGRGDEPPLLLTFGISIMIQNLLLYFFSANAAKLQTPILLKSIPVTDRIFIPVAYLLACVVGAAIIVALGLYLRNTYLGRSIRATSDDVEAARLMGINIKNTFGIAMGISMMTGAVAGVMLGILFNFYPSSGPTYLITAFAVVIIGGIGSIYGTLAAGLIFGLAQALGGYFIGVEFQQLIGYLVLLVMLIFRPQGLFSR